MSSSRMIRFSLSGLGMLLIGACAKLDEQISYICWIDHTRGTWVGSKYTPPGVEICAPISIRKLPPTAVVTSSSERSGISQESGIRQDSGTRSTSITSQSVTAGDGAVSITETRSDKSTLDVKAEDGGVNIEEKSSSGSTLTVTAEGGRTSITYN